MEEGQELSWTAPEYYHYPKTGAWFWTTLVLAVVFLVFALIERNFLFAVFLVIAEALVATWGRRMPPILMFTLTPNGIALGTKKFYPYTNLEGFAIMKPGIDPDLEELVLQTKNTVNPYVKIMIPRDRRDEIENFMRAIIPEIEYEEPLIERLGHIVRF